MIKITEQEKLQEKARALVKQASLEELKEMWLYWYGVEFLVECLSNGIDDEDAKLRIQRFIDAFKNKREVK